MKSIIVFINKYLLIFSLIINGSVTLHKLEFFISSLILSLSYIIILSMAFFIIYATKLKPISKCLNLIILWIHLVLHGIFLITFPVGIVFALIGSYLLAFQITLLFYIPSAIVVFFNIYVIKNMSYKNSIDYT